MSEIATTIEEILGLQGHFTARASPAMEERKERVEELAQAFATALARGGSSVLAVKGSNGLGNNARVPWVRMFDPAQSPSPTKGWYIVLLFSADGSAAYLSLNQGVTQLKQGQIAENVQAGRRALGAAPLVHDEERERRAGTSMDLSDRGLGARYEKGNLLCFEYARGTVPSDGVIEKDLEWLAERLGVLPMTDEETLPEWGEPQQDTPPTDDEAMRILCSSIHWDEHEVLELLESLLDESPQIVLTGPPGTGKTFVAQHLAAYLLGLPGEVRNNPYIEVVQFHPSYGYEDFVEGLRPVPSEGGLLEFRAHPGVLLRMADAIAEDGMPRVLILDEMNRANIPKVFGELMYLLEYRDQEIRLMHRERFSLPRELYIIGTMNTADRSVKNLDLALRRRFDFKELPPSEMVLRRHYALSHANALGEVLFLGFTALNAAIEAAMGDRHSQVGHSYFMKARIDRAVLKRIWNQQLFPLIEDYFFDRPELASEFTLERFWADDPN